MIPIRLELWQRQLELQRVINATAAKISQTHEGLTPARVGNCRGP